MNESNIFSVIREARAEGIVPCLREVNIAYGNFSGMDFSEVDLRFADITACNFRCAHLTHAILRECRGQYARFGCAHMVGLNAAHACLAGAEFAGADLREAIFRHADLREADFSGANLQFADFTGADLEGAKFDTSDLRGSVGIIK